MNVFSDIKVKYMKQIRNHLRTLGKYNWIFIQFLMFFMILYFIISYASQLALADFIFLTNYIFANFYKMKITFMIKLVLTKTIF